MLTAAGNWKIAAWQRSAGARSGLVVADVDMPRMGRLRIWRRRSENRRGFESCPSFYDRAPAFFRFKTGTRGMEAGADAYLNKDRLFDS